VTVAVPPVYERTAVVTKIVDGDTLHTAVDLGCDTTLNMTVRLYGINAPEMSTPEGVVAKQFAADWIAGRAADGFLIRTVKDHKEKYGRYLADLLAADGTSLCQALLDSGNAVVYLP
jgi:micrococcal nuclease